jgi:hypothetical protein
VNASLNLFRNGEQAELIDILLEGMLKQTSNSCAESPYLTEPMEN